MVSFINPLRPVQELNGLGSDHTYQVTTIMCTSVGYTTLSNVHVYADYRAASFKGVPSGYENGRRVTKLLFHELT